MRQECRVHLLFDTTLKRPCRPAGLSSGCPAHHFRDNIGREGNVFTAQCRMHEEHNARFSEFPGNRQSCLRSPFGGKCRLHVDFATATGKAWNPLGSDFRDNSISAPTRTECLRMNERIILVVRMANVLRRRRHAQSRQVGKPLSKHGSVFASCFHPARQLAQLQPPNGRLNLC